MRQILFVLPGLLFLSLPAAAQPDSEAIVQFGLEGHWAVSCTAAPAPTNPHVVIAASASAPPTRQLRTGNAEIDNVLPLTNARLIDESQITFQELMEGKTVTFLVVRKEGRYQVVEMVSGDGKALVMHGQQMWDNKPSPWYSRCQ
jgi:hypothetical protein